MFGSDSMGTSASIGASRLDESAALRRLLAVTAKETGQEFFRSLVRSLSEVLVVEGAWVTEYLEDQRHLRSLAFWLSGEFQPTYVYDVTGTPCEPVVGGRFVHVPDRVVELYPEDTDLQEFSAVSYMGMPFTDSDGRVLGHLAILDTEPFPEEPYAVALFKVFADRAAAEVRRLRAEKGLREREEQLARLLDSAKDAILELDAELRVTRPNPAAERLFDEPVEAMRGVSLEEFLDPESWDRLRLVAGDLAARPPGERSAWVPGELQVLGPDGSIPTEASLARSAAGSSVFYTLILRNLLDKLEAERRIQSLEIEAEVLLEEIEQLRGFDEIVGRSRPMIRVLRDVERLAETTTTVLIQGETGTGKELIARAIHRASGRADRPLVKVNCAAIPEDLIESELFGHRKGAFTGATDSRDGRFALADGGTIFLDEVGELPLHLQPKLLRVLQEGEFEPVGSDRTRAVDVRVIAATNRNLEAEVSTGRFRSDLYYRLVVFPIQIPPLRDRGDDVVLLAHHLAAKLSREMGRPLPELAPDTERRLKAYNWPGNVRELQNVIEREMVVSRNGPMRFDHVLTSTESPRTETVDVAEERIHTVEEMRIYERANLVRALEAAGWRVSGADGAARLLGMPPSTLSSRMKALGIRPPD